jgi:hypothetical protein
MRVSKFHFALFAGALAAGICLMPLSAGAAVPRSRSKSHNTPSTNGSQHKSTPLDTVIGQIIKREHDEITAFELFDPIVETYIQNLKPDRDMGTIPRNDAYFIGQADLTKGIEIHSMLQGNGFLRSLLPEFSEEKSWNPRGFLQMIYVDAHDFDRENYDFKYAGQDFLGSVRCLMFDVSPKAHSRKRRFKGRIWVEDRDYTIVRFNGAYVPERRFLDSDFTVHFDSWRMNVQPDLWLPAYIFTEGVNKKPGGFPGFKAQTRLWGYSSKAAAQESEFSALYIESDKQIQDDDAQHHDRSPIEEQRQFDRDAEDNVIDTLVRAGLIAPEGPVDKVLDTVLNNLEVTNNLDIEPEPRCRVMLTSNIELFSIGHTIVLSRGLLDVLPDESTLAVMLAQELSDAMILKPSLSEYGFYDLLQTPTTQAMKKLSFKDDQEELQATSTNTLTILRNSPYRSNLGSAALFLKKLSDESKQLRYLVGPHLGNRILPIAALMNSGPALEPDKITQIAALPMGSRIKIDPWNDQIRMIKATPVPLQSAREKMPFEITPFMPFLERYKALHAAEEASSGETTHAEDAQVGPAH